MAWGSNSIPAAWNDLRAVGAAARELLLRAAAARWNTRQTGLRTERGFVIATDGRKLGYGELAEAASQLKPAASAPAPKTPAQYVLIGQDAGDVDAHDIVTGRQHFAIDDWFGDTLVAVIARCPFPGGKLASLDDAAALKVKGVTKVMTIPAPSAAQAVGTQQLAAGVAVLAHDTWSALQGSAKLDVRWQPGATAAHGDDTLAQAAATALQGDPTDAVRSDGDVAHASKHARYTFKAEYRFATLTHAELEPPNALVQVDSQRAVVIAPVQNPRVTFETVRRLTGLAPDKIDIRLPRAGGGFGRFLETDYIAEAVLLAKTAGKPLKLLWTRADAFAHDTYRPFSVHQLQACADRKHALTGWTHHIASTSRLAGREPRSRWWLSEMHPDDLPAGLIDNLQYAWYALDSALPRGSYRASSQAWTMPPRSRSRASPR
jgi:isoquinoline 1-oxidoreductase beta subunit